MVEYSDDAKQVNRSEEESDSFDVCLTTEKKVYGYWHFLTEVSRDSYKINRDKRTPRKEYNLEHPKLTFLHDTLYGMNWRKLLVPQRTINRTLVNEFYTCVYEAMKDKDKFDADLESVQVRGVEFDFRPD